MTEHWSTATLAEVCTIKPPKAEARKKLSESDLVSFLPMADLNIGEMHAIPSQVRQLKAVSGSYTYFAEGDVLLAKITPCFENGKLGIASELQNGIGFGSSEYIVFRPNETLSKEWLCYYLSRERFREEAKALMGGAVGHKRVSKEFIETYSIPIPSLPEQVRIVAILKEAFTAIAAATVNTENNVHNARELFQSVLQSTFEQNGKTWFEAQLGDLCHRITDGKHGDCTNEEGSGYYFLSAKDVREGTLNYDGAREITKEDFEETHRRTNLEAGDILVTNSGTIGRMAIAPTDERTRRTTFQKSVAILKPIKEHFDTRFAFHSLSSSLSRFVNLSAGAAQKNLLLRDLRSFRFMMPKSIEDQRCVAVRLDAFSKETKKLEAIYQHKLESLAELKQSILHKAFTGELTSEPKATDRELSEAGV